MSQGAIDNDYDESLRNAREDMEAELAGFQRTPVEGGLAFDLLTRQLLFVRKQVADSLVEYNEREGFDLSTYKAHPYLPITVDDAVYEVAFVPSNPEGAHNVSKTYDYPQGRLMPVPIHLAWQEDDE